MDCMFILTLDEYCIPSAPRLKTDNLPKNDNAKHFIQQKISSVLHPSLKKNPEKTCSSNRLGADSSIKPSKRSSKSIHNKEISPNSEFISDESNPSNSISACDQCKNNEGLLREVINSIEKLKNDVTYLIHINQSKEQEVLGDYNIDCMNSFEELTEFNKKLDDEEVFRQTCIKLGLIGGKDSGSATRKILSQIISRELFLQLNWTGRNHKNGLKDNINILKLIVASVRRNPDAKNATIEEVETLY